MKNALFLTALPLCLAAAAPAAAAPSMAVGPYAPAAAEARASEPSLEQIRAATERFRSVDVALAEGYVRDPTDTCETASIMGRPAEFGAMGIHFFRPDLLGISAPPNPRVNGNGTHTDWSRPSILIYEPQADGSLQLVAVENLVFQAAWHAAGHSERPTINGRQWDRMEDDPSTPTDEAHGFEPHYDQHIWLYRDNPRGLYEPFNPNVSCAHHRRRSADAGHGHGHARFGIGAAGH